jgi:hypothetical protein
MDGHNDSGSNLSPGVFANHSVFLAGSVKEKGVVDSTNQPNADPQGRLVRGISLRLSRRSRCWTRYYLSRCEPLRDLCDLYPHILTLLCPWDKDHKSVDSGDSLPPLAGVGDAYVVLLADLNRLLEGTGTSSEASSIAIPSALSKTQFLSPILPLFRPMNFAPTAA